MSSNATYVGFWVDWSKGSTLGSTLTLPSRSGILLTAALALFVQFTGTHFWGIVTFTLHQMRSSPKPHDGLFYQQQAILRNSSAGDALTQLMKVTMAWTSKSTRRNLLLMLTATLHLVGFIVAGIFSSNVVIENPGVLIRGSSCGLWPSHLNLTQKVQVNFTEQVDFSKNYLENAMLSARDVKSCIPPNTTSLINPEDEHECDVSTGKVKWHVDLAAACPFAPEMCIGSRTGAVQLNSGHLDSDLDFGINAPPQSRVTYQKILTCAPINTKGFTSDEWTAGSNYSTDPTAGYLYFYYGPSQPYVYNSITAYAYTSWVSNHTALTYHTVAPTSQDVLYYLDIHDSPWDFSPIKQLNQTEADVSLFFLTSMPYFMNQVDDPWFSAHINITFSSQPPTASSGLKFYLADYHVSVLGCTEQHQFCNPTKPLSSGCTPLAGTVQVNNSLGGLGFNPLQQATAQRMFETMGQTTLPRIAKTLGTGYMVAASSLSGTVSLPLPSDQWVLEVFNWADVAMATFQRRVIEFATGPSTPDFARYLRDSSTAEQRTMCLNQKVPSPPGYTSFSVVGLSIILALSVLIIGVNCFLEPTVHALQKWQNKGLHRHMAWVLDGTLQLQRMAYESSGLGHWDKCAKEIPITPLGEQFPLATTSDPEHPTLSPRIPDDQELNTFSGAAQTDPAAVQPTQPPKHPIHWGMARSSGYMSLPDDGVGEDDVGLGYEATRR
ncbi:hypothetical protein LPUS_05668 [Lasallia pustulata]|uniref:Uncharacterized protein n=1 Tax=Lasallia pustulata TaxID=136370 RepID=A0A1W5CZ83_9LECA|nr:hypothetical protein LPUS_05668 [Lasallia pustulata]